jgi:Obg family GTPase CgtA-like protein
MSDQQRIQEQLERSSLGTPAAKAARRTIPTSYAERVVAMADLTNIEAMEYVQHRLRTMGVERALARAGARDGDVVRIGPVELDYVEGIG